jgi:hypothetical protein
MMVGAEQDQGDSCDLFGALAPPLADPGANCQTELRCDEGLERDGRDDGGARSLKDQDPSAGGGSATGVSSAIWTVPLLSPAHCRIRPQLIKAAPLRGTALFPATGLYGFGARPARERLMVRRMVLITVVFAVHSGGRSAAVLPSSPGAPSRGCRVKGTLRASLSPWQGQCHDESEGGQEVELRGRGARDNGLERSRSLTTADADYLALLRSPRDQPSGPLGISGPGVLDTPLAAQPA